MRTHERQISIGMGNLPALWVRLESFLERVWWMGEGYIRRRRVAPSLAGEVPERQLLLALSSDEDRRGVFWETAGFLVLWLSGVAGIAISLV